MGKLLILTASILIIFFLRGALMPLWVGIALAYILDPLVTFYESKLKAHRFLSVILSYITLLVSCAVLIWGFADIISGELKSGSLQKSLSIIEDYYLKYKDFITEFLGFSISEKTINAALKNFGGSAINLLVGLVVSIYLLKDKDFFLSLLNSLGHLFFKQKTHGLIREIFFDINDVVGAFIRGVLIDSVIIALLDSLVLSLLGVNYAIFIGCFAGVVNVIPYFGPLIGMVPAFIFGYSSGGLTLAIMSVIGLLLIQQLESNIIYPKIVGESVGLHPLFVLLSVSTAAYLGGVLFMILAVPIASIFKILICAWAYRQK